jgi:hypothetical protein
MSLSDSLVSSETDDGIGHGSPGVETSVGHVRNR